MTPDPTAQDGPYVAIKVKLGAPLSQVVGASSVELSLPPGATLDTLLQELQSRLPGFQEGLRGKGLSITSDQVLYVLFLNARPVAWEQTTATPLRKGDKVYLFLPVAGG